MQIKKTTFIIVFISAIFVSASFMVAKAYEPLVRLPGLPSTGDINLSQYVVGLYNFLLSIVGIVAVMMLIIGGMKYITAAGNASVISDAKDTIWNALWGLLLALLSWVIVSTINPDVLYIKDPASSLVGGYTVDLGACGEYDSVVCTCNDDTVPASPPVITNQDECNIACSENCGTTEPFPCVVNSNDPFIKDGVKMCSCVDGNPEVVLSAAALAADAKCNEVCSNPAYTVPSEYHGISHDVSFGTELITSDGGVSVSGGPLEADLLGLKSVYFDLTEMRDCKNDIISRALNYNGEPLFGLVPNEVCCEERHSSCMSWTVFCNATIAPFVYVVPSCDNSTYVEDPSGYLIYKHSYLLSGLKKVWFGITSDGPAGCQEVEFAIEIEVE